MTLQFTYREGAVPIALTLSEADAILSRLDQLTGVKPSATLLRAKEKIQRQRDFVQSRKDFRL